MAKHLEQKVNPRPSHFLDFMRRVVVCSVYPKRIVAESRGEDLVLARDAGNFAARYRGMVQERSDLLPELMAAITQSVDGLKGLRLVKVSQDARVLMAMFDDHGTRYELSLDEISDGQLALIVLYALLHFAGGQGTTIFLDEPDSYLAVAEIQPWLMALSEACGVTVSQAIACSHHPELIDYLGAARGLLLDRAGSGHATVRSLADQQVNGAMKLSEIIWPRADLQVRR